MEQPASSVTGGELETDTFGLVVTMRLGKRFRFATVSFKDESMFAHVIS